MPSPEKKQRENGTMCSAVSSADVELRPTDDSKMKNEASQQKKSSFAQKLKDIRCRYAESFTVHGFSHIIMGKLLEKILWLICLIAVLVAAVFMTYRLFDSYLKHDVDSKISIKLKFRIKLPTIFLCDSSMYNTVMTYANCSSTAAQSYDSRECSSVNRKCPNLCEAGKCSKEEADQLDMSCPPELHGQCLALNPQKTILQTFHKPWSWYHAEGLTKNVSIQLYVRPPGAKDVFFSIMYDQDYHDITRPGLYTVYLEKTVIERQPPPYTTCIEVDGEVGKEKSMFVGPYTVTKCLATCDFKNKWKHCNTTFWAARNLMRDKSFVREDRELEDIKDCTNNHTNKEWDDIFHCYDDCRPPCFEELYKVRVEYKPNEGENGTKLYFTIDRKETHIIEEPAQDLLNVLSAFGGTLGLMAGVSVLSLLELAIWTIVFLVETIARCCYRSR